MLKTRRFGAYFARWEGRCFQFSNSTKYFDQKWKFHNFSITSANFPKIHDISRPGKRIFKFHDFSWPYEPCKRNCGDALCLAKPYAPMNFKLERERRETRKCLELNSEFNWYLAVLPNVFRRFLGRVALMLSLPPFPALKFLGALYVYLYIEYINLIENYLFTQCENLFFWAKRNLYVIVFLTRFRLHPRLLFCNTNYFAHQFTFKSSWANTF